MALEAVVYPEDSLSSNYGYKECNYSSSGNWSYDFPFPLPAHHTNSAAFLDFLQNGNNIYGQDHHQLEMDPNNSEQSEQLATTAGRRKRRRVKSTKNKEEIENQRMTHIAVERNRRKQMNEYLSLLRSLMPASYVPRGDQASIIGGAINFVKELEQQLQNMEAQNKLTKPDSDDFSSPFADFFSFPQYSKRTPATGDDKLADQNQSECGIADIEVAMVESHANLKIRSKKRPRQLFKMVAGFQGLKLTILHLNVTTLDQIVLYSISVKVEEGCRLNTVDEMAAAVNQMLHRIHDVESAFSS